MPTFDEIIVIIWRVLLVMMILALVTTWIMFVIAANALSVAKKKGERIQALCGAEYMEIESERHSIQKAYNKLGLTLVLAIGITTFTTLIGTSAVIIPHVLTLYKSKEVLSMIVYVCLLVTFLVISALELLTVLPKILKTMKYQSIVSLNTKQYFNTYSIASASILFGMGAFFLWTSTKIDTNDKKEASVRVLLVLSMVALIGYKVLIGSDVLSITKKAIVPYAEKVRTLNTEIRNLLTKTETKLAMETYLRRNIHRIHPNMDVEPVLNPSLGKGDPFYDTYYLYVEHRGGKESIQEMDNTTRISLKTMKSLLGKMYTYNFPSNTNVNLNDLQPISNEGLKTAKFPNNTQARAIRGWIYDLYVGTRNEDSISFSKKDFETAAKLYTEPLNPNSNALSSRLNALSAGSNINVSYFKRSVNSSTTNTGGSGGGSGQLQPSGSNVENFQGSASTPPVIPPNDVEDLVHSTLLVSDAYLNTSVAIDDVFTNLAANTNMTTVVKNAIATEITLYKDTSAMQSLQSKMRDMRNMSPIMKGEINKFVKHVFWVSLVILFIAGFIVFHMVYQKVKTKNLSEMLVMMIAIVMLLLIVVGAMYQWIMGVTQL